LLRPGGTPKTANQDERKREPATAAAYTESAERHSQPLMKSWDTDLIAENAHQKRSLKSDRQSLAQRAAHRSHRVALSVVIPSKRFLRREDLGVPRRASRSLRRNIRALGPLVPHLLAKCTQRSRFPQNSRSLQLKLTRLPAKFQTTLKRRLSRRRKRGVEPANSLATALRCCNTFIVR
jgi:hypothetical protein